MPLAEIQNEENKTFLAVKFKMREKALRTFLVITLLLVPENSDDSVASFYL